MKKVSAFLIIFMALISACTVKNPNLPEWDITLNIPLINQKYYMRDLVDSVNIVADTSNVVFLRNEGEIVTQEFGNVPFRLDVDTGSVPIFSGQEIPGSASLIDPDTGYEISYGELSAGIIEARFDNINSAVESIRITFVELRNADNSPYVIEYSESGWQEHSLVGKHLGSVNSNLVLADLNYSVQIIASSLPANTPVGEMRLRINDPFLFSVFQGRLPNFRVETNDTISPVDIDYPLGMENAVQLIEAGLQIQLYNRIGFECEFHGEFYARNSNTNEERTIQILDENGEHYILAPAVGDTPSVNEINYSHNITSMISIMPDHIEIRNSYFLIRNSISQALGTVRNTDFIDGIYTINAPFRFILHNERVIVRQEIEMEISQSNQDRIRKNALSAGMEMEFINHFPFGATAELFIGNSPNINVDNPASYAFKKTASFDPGGLESIVQIMPLALSKEELDVFANPKVYLRWAFTFNETVSPITITASPTDFIHVRSMINTQIHIEGEE